MRERPFRQDMKSIRACKRLDCRKGQFYRLWREMEFSLHLDLEHQWRQARPRLHQEPRHRRHQRRAQEELEHREDFLRRFSREHTSRRQKHRLHLSHRLQLRVAGATICYRRFRMESSSRKQHLAKKYQMEQLCP